MSDTLRDDLRADVGRTLRQYFASGNGPTLEDILSQWARRVQRAEADRDALARTFARYLDEMNPGLVEFCGHCGAPCEVVRPGKTQCHACDWWQFAAESPYVRAEARLTPERLARAIALVADEGMVCTDGHHGRLSCALCQDVLAAAIVAALQAVGIILVIAMLITPGATAFMLVKRFDRMLAVSVAVAVCSTLAGAYVSFFADASPAACIVLIQSALFIAALCLAPGKGLLRRPRPAAAR